MARTKLIVAALLLAFAQPAAAQTYSRAYASPYWPSYFQALFQTFPDCGNGAVAARIIDRFNWADRNTWYRGLTIGRIDGQYERTIEAFGPSPVHRRYCRAYAWFSDGKKRTVHYRISAGMGLAGTGFKVEFCVPGYDRWRVYDGNCRVLVR